ncbi:MAG: hypothetical protein KatS3mg061_2807 [Dehalococcoidia bacterium]|nr:MAG: hypothetical protein KatS3mg061_2807 [Dehalococcoidia bacterium]
MHAGRRVVALTVVPVVAGVLLTFSLALYLTEIGARQVHLQGGTTQPDRLDILADVVTIDINRYEMLVRLAFVPRGALSSADGVTLARDLVLLVNAASGPSERQLAAGRLPSPTEVTLSLYGGEAADFPFDAHQATLLLTVGSGHPPSLEPMPLALEVVAGVHGLAVQAEIVPTRDGTLEVQFSITRSWATKGFALLTMATMWSLALIVLGLTVAVVAFGKKIEATIFSWLGAMLFAFPALRNAAPGAPPIGTLGDYLAFFWAETIVALCVVLIAVVYIRRPLPK